MSPLPPDRLTRLRPLVAAWLPGQRWYAGKGETVDVHAVRTLGPLGTDPHPSEVLVVDTGAGTYQVPVVYRRELEDHLEHAHIGTLDGPQGLTHVVDALHDKSVTGAWLRGIADGRTAETGLTFHRDAPDAEILLDEPSLAIPAEQSNTSLVFGDAAILKVFRRLQPGVNPDIEVHAALGKLGARHVARLLGHVSGAWVEDSGSAVRADLAMLQEFLRSATDGWQLALISVRDLFAEGDLHADEVGGDFAAEARRLGLATAETHTDLAAAFGTGAFTAPSVGELADGMERRLAEVADEVPDVGPYVGGLTTVIDRLRTLDAPVATQRIHGDYHLGQVMRTTQRWVLLDFEGEPLKSLTERTTMDSPLRDVAGMLRSFDYAGRSVLADRPNDPQVAYRAQEWAERNRSAFLDGYAEGSGRDPRTDPAATALLEAYEVDKAVYEVAYEARMRPAWLPIPMAAIARLIAGQTGIE